jgi:hypothetical protein
MLGVPELITVVVLIIGWLVPLVAGVWALVTLYRLREGQAAMRTSLERIEQRLQRP